MRHEDQFENILCGLTDIQIRKFTFYINTSIFKIRLLLPGITFFGGPKIIRWMRESKIYSNTFIDGLQFWIFAQL